MRAAQISATEMKLGKLASQRAGAEEVQMLGRRLYVTQAKTIAALRELSRMKGVTLPMAPSAAQKKMLSQMGAKLGRAFDQAYREYLSSYPAGAIQVFAQGARTAQDRDVRYLAERTLGELKSRRPRATSRYLMDRKASAASMAKTRARKQPEKKPAPSASAAKRKTPAAAKPSAREKKKSAQSSTAAGKPKTLPAATSSSQKAQATSPAARSARQTTAPVRKEVTSRASRSVPASAYTDAELRAAPKAKVVRRPR